MSITLPNVDMSLYAVGQVFTIDLSNAGITSSLNQYKTPAHLQLYNDSGSGISISFKEGASATNLPAGGWQTLPLVPGESALICQVLYVLPTPPVTLLMLTYYAPGEDVPVQAVLGNSPVGIGGTVNTSSVNQLINDGNPPGTNVLTTRVSSDPASFTINLTNDAQMTFGSQTFPGSINNNANVFQNADIIMANGQNYAAYDSGGNVKPLIGATASNTTAISAVGQFIEIYDDSGVLRFTLDMSNHILFTDGGLGVVNSSTGDVIMTSSVTNTYIDGTASSVMRWSGNNGFIVNNAGATFVQGTVFWPLLGTLKGWQMIQGTGSVTVSHSLGSPPNFMAISGNNASPGIGYHGATNTTITINCSATVGWFALAMVF